MEKIKDFIINIDIPELADYASFLGLIFSIITLILVYFIKKRLKAKVRIPELLEDLKVVISGISIFIGSNYTKDRLVLYKNLAECKSLINYLIPYAEKETKIEINKLKSKLKTNSNIFIFKYIFEYKDITNFNENDIEEVYIIINIIVSNMTQQLKNMRIE
ncbi:hypothetical protein [Aliarcobacter cryaerophilus]|uniref:hypothetical protein n=1 Tax=Aliarcobacter cryaerophilus TaxID=28198 RepID=UPI0021B5DBD5|nr:hypothetical protein [Aliarcobacter cryaerophilus]MCT7465772.1 hypothetical protein [Aliarcobacter cryaerophilus]